MFGHSWECCMLGLHKSGIEVYITERRNNNGKDSIVIYNRHRGM